MRVPELIIEELECSETYQDQRPGTSGLRKRVETFTNGTYLQNFVQAIIDCIPYGPVNRHKPIIVSGDGRFFNKEASQIIIAMLAANGFSHVIVGINFLLSTPAVSTIIRKFNAIGGIILTASHNPGGPDGDFGVKYNVSNGGAAPDFLTEKIFERSKTLKSFKITKGFPIVDSSKIGEFDYGGVKIEVVDGPSIHLSFLKTIFDFRAIKGFLHRSGFQVLYDGMSGVAGPTARKLFIEEFGLPESYVTRSVPLPDFGGAHPDPNLTYAPELVRRMGLGPDADKENIPDFGAANDGDMDRNMILGKQFFVTPSDSLAIIAAHASVAIPYYVKNPLKGVARSMPTSCAVDRVAEKLSIAIYEVPTGWKYFCNLMDSGAIGICGEESFGTGSDHIREKDGMWAVLAWLSIMEYNNRDGHTSVGDVVQRHWRQYGRNYYCRYDYESVNSNDANQVFTLLRRYIVQNTPELFVPFKLALADEFKYVDPVDGSVAEKQGIRFIFGDGSRIIYRLSGTGSVGATIRIYMERYESHPERVNEDPSVALGPLIKIALSLSDIAKLTGRNEPTVIT